MDLSSLPPVVESVLRIASAATRHDNESLISLVFRILLGAFSYCFVYTRIAGALLNTMAYLVAHRWYILAMTCSIIVLLVSAALLSLLQWMFNWQGRLLASVSDPRRLRRLVHVEDDDHDDDSILAWAKMIGRSLLICVLWAVYCVVNVHLDYALFWHQYSAGNPIFNLELLVVNSLQAGPILLGSVYAMYHLVPSLFASTMTAHPQSSLPVNTAADEYMQTLLS
jgi:hypothetical protein